MRLNWLQAHYLLLFLVALYWNVGQPNNDDGTEDCVSVFSGGWHANPYLICSWSKMKFSGYFLL
uniref:Uncharacterized protein n=1 Tax=Pygocentrus nattereri TaxID=42514 RepID=A0A3B4D8S8_PYGNA